ncbi:hypothetical protein AMELA_G00127070 [Ameiurus melas]|uniref:Ig-like domain-containing protein n=1 Tax=Ameiurus melas TaxID=219545 RepID=A0A7J6AQB3_AMEME|nr:hypothetical protein AMELA_G00127070 [Ameiurus melas]
MISVIIFLPFFLFWTAVLTGENGVTQSPSIAWHLKGESGEMKCSHNKGAGYYQMYWYRQRHGESMEFIVYTMANSEPDFGSVDKKMQFLLSSYVGAVLLKSGRKLFTFYYIRHVHAISAQFKTDIQTFNMIRAASIIWVLIICPRGFSQSDRVFQTPPDLLGHHKHSVKIQCEHSVPSYNQINWYRETHDLGLTLIGYQVGKSSTQIENDFKLKVEIAGDGNKNVSLPIKNLLSNDSMVYFCAAYYTVLHLCYIQYKNPLCKYSQHLIITCSCGLLWLPVFSTEKPHLHDNRQL